MNSSEENWQEKLYDLTRKLDARVCFEAVAGQTTGDICNNMPPKSKILMYGCLSMADMGGINSIAFMGRGLTIESWMFNEWILEKRIWSLVGFVNEVQKMMQNKTLHSEINRRVEFDQIEEAIAEYKENMTKGKMLVFPNKD